MKNIIILALFGLIGLSAQANQNNFECTKAALKIAKSIRMVEMKKEAKSAVFRIVSKEIDLSSPNLEETYVIEMLIKGENGKFEKSMTDQELVMVGGGTCILAQYSMPGAG